MRIKRILTPFLFIFALAISTLSTHAASKDIEEIIKKLDALYRADTCRASISMKIMTPHWERALEMKTWSSKMDKTFIRLLSPKKEKGVGTLRIKTEMWNYLPKVNKVIKIPPSMMMGSWMGSDFSNDDLVKESSMLDDYDYSLHKPDKPEPGLLYIKLIPKEDKPIVWSKIIAAIKEKGYLPVRYEYFDEKDNLMRTLEFSDIKKFSDREIPAVMVMVPQNKEGYKTVITYTKAEFNIKLKKDIFSLRNLRTPY